MNQHSRSVSCTLWGEGKPTMWISVGNWLRTVALIFKVSGSVCLHVLLLSFTSNNTFGLYGYWAASSLQIKYIQFSFTQLFSVCEWLNWILFVKPSSSIANIPRQSVLTFSWPITHYGMAPYFSLLAASATDGQQALCHSWMCCTLVCVTYVKNSTAELLKVNKVTANLLLGSFNHHRER